MEFKKIEQFIRKQNVSFICSVDENGCPNVKAMLKPRKMNGLKEFYFSTNTSSLRVKQFLNNPNASIYFYRKGLIKYIGVMLVGKMEVLTDQDTKDMIWRKGDTKFYKKGVTEYHLIFKQGFSANTLYRIKKGESINTKTLDALCYALDCEVSDIIKFEKE